MNVLEILWCLKNLRAPKCELKAVAIGAAKHKEIEKRMRHGQSEKRQ